MRLKYQIFVTFLLFSVLLVALLAVLNSWSFNRGFTNYFVNNEKQRLHTVAEEIANRYQQNQSWQWIENQPDIFRDILLGDARSRGLKIPNGDFPPGKRKQRLLLVDENKRLLVGREVPKKNVYWHPIVSDESTIAYLGIREPRGLPGEIENAFIAQQIKNHVAAAIVTVFLSALLAIALASRIVKPILKVNTVVGHIIKGEFKHRINTRRKDELGDVARNINQMAHTLDNNQAARQQWMAEISHELRTPVAILQGELEAIQDGVKTPDAAAIDSLHTESVRLGLLIDDLHELTLSDVGALNYRMEPLDFSEILSQRLYAAKHMLSQARLTVSSRVSDSLGTIQGDSQRLAQLIDNLLQNSVRYTNEGGQVDIVLSSTATELTLQWCDSMPGVTDDQLPNLFNLLYRTEESRSREFGGSGLGLAIVKKIVLAHQGSIDAFHSDTGGLGILVKLPL